MLGHADTAVIGANEVFEHPPTMRAVQQFSCASFSSSIELQKGAKQIFVTIGYLALAKSQILIELIEFHLSRTNISTQVV